MGVYALARALVREYTKGEWMRWIYIQIVINISLASPRRRRRAMRTRVVASHRRARGATDDDAAHKISRAKRGHFFGARARDDARTFGVGMRMVRTFGVGNRHTDMGTHAQGTHAPWIPRGANGARARSPRGCVDGLNDVDSARRRRYSRDDGED